MNKLTLSAFSDITGYSMAQLSSYKKKQMQTLFRFIEEEGQSYIICTNAELRQYRENMKANTIEAEAEKTVEKLDTLEKTINDYKILFESFFDDYQKRLTEREAKFLNFELDTQNKIMKSLESIDNDNSAIVRAIEDISKLKAELIEIINTSKSVNKDIEARYGSIQAIIASISKQTETLTQQQKQTAEYSAKFVNNIKYSVSEIGKLDENVNRYIREITDARAELSKKQTKDSIKSYLLKYILPVILIAISSIIALFLIISEFKSVRADISILQQQSGSISDYVQKKAIKK